MLEDWTRSDTIAAIAIVVSLGTTILTLVLNHLRAKADREARREEWERGRRAALRDEASSIVARVKGRILAHKPDEISTTGFDQRLHTVGDLLRAWYRDGGVEGFQRLMAMNELMHVPKMARVAHHDVQRYMDLLAEAAMRDRPIEPAPSVRDLLERLEHKDGGVQERNPLPPVKDVRERDEVWSVAQSAWNEAQLGVAQLEATIRGRGPHDEDAVEMS